MKSRRREAVWVNIWQKSQPPAVSDTQEIKIIRMFAVSRENGNGVNARAIVMKLAFDTAIFRGVEKVPIAARAAVVSPVRDCGIVAKNCVEGDIGFVLITEIFHPCIH